MVSVELIVEKFIEKIQIVELETIIPQLVKVHEIIERLVEKIVPIYYREEVAIETPVIQEKIVAVSSNTTSKEAVQVIKEKTTTVNKIVEANNVVNHIEKEIQLVDRYEKTEVPVYTTVERIVEVPQIL